MTNDEILQAAKEVGAAIDVLMLGRHDNTVFTTGELERFAAIIEKARLSGVLWFAKCYATYRCTPINKRHKTTAPQLSANWENSDA